MGISGGIQLEHETCSFALGKGIFHDAAAVLISDGKMVAAIEEERLNRIKHTKLAPTKAIRFCLESYGADIRDVDCFAYYFEDGVLTAALQNFNLMNVARRDRFPDFPSWLRQVIGKEFNHEIEPRKLKFFRHHLTHAMSAFAPSGFGRSLVLTTDAMGEREAGLLLIGEGSRLKPLRSFSVKNSLGFFYSNLIQFIGFQFQEEYKVMGLAPYGDPARYRDTLKSLYDLLPDGDYVIHEDRYYWLEGFVKPRKRSDELNQSHMDFAASLQEALETIVFHILKHYQSATGEKNLCLAGGVAQNCTLNGKLLRSGLFEKVFVQPASYDAGCAIGAALCAQAELEPASELPKLDHVYLGSEIGDLPSILSALQPWEDFIDYQLTEDACAKAAEMIAEGRVIGWAQGRSEFGPRALGNRSILADPRPSKNKDIINAMVKKREAFRPFAPSVLEEEADLFFEMPQGVEQLPYMAFIVKVREEKQKLLGAITHVDGTARIQTVSKRTNEKFWRLISAFKAMTGLPVLLNTSFNNNAEPIVNSVEDAVVSFLTTGLHFLFVGDYLVSKKQVVDEALLLLRPLLPRHLKLSHTRRATEQENEYADGFELTCSFDEAIQADLSQEMFEALRNANGTKRLAELVPQHIIAEAEARERFLNETKELWSQRLIRLRP